MRVFAGTCGYRWGALMVTRVAIIPGVPVVAEKGVRRGV